MPITITEYPDNDPPVMIVEGLTIEHPNLDGGRASVSIMVEINLTPPRQERDTFLRWVQEEALAAIRTNDDRIAARPSIWPDGSEHTVYRAWHLRQPGADAESVSVWSTPAPPFHC